MAMTVGSMRRSFSAASSTKRPSIRASMGLAMAAAASMRTGTRRATTTRPTSDAPMSAVTATTTTATAAAMPASRLRRAVQASDPVRPRTGSPIGVMAMSTAVPSHAAGTYRPATTVTIFATVAAVFAGLLHCQRWKNVEVLPGK
ncbi:MAG: hypothetical protein R2690_01245 [Acidimicrobiales bacterium]